MDPAQLARRVFNAIDRRDREALGGLIHPEASLEMAMARGDLVQGRASVLAALESGWQEVHSLSIRQLRPVSETTVIIVGRSRHPSPMGGHADSACVWLCEYRDGMLWRQRLFSDIDEALGAANVSA